MNQAVIPESEGEAVAVTFRLPESLLRRVDSAAKATGNSRSAVLHHLIRWALAQYEEEQRSGGAARTVTARR